MRSHYNEGLYCAPLTPQIVHVHVNKVGELRLSL